MPLRTFAPETKSGANIFAYEEATMPRARLWLCSTVCPTALVLASPYEGEDDDFVVICTNRAVLDVGLLSLHYLRADSLIRGQVSNSIVIESLPF